MSNVITLHDPRTLPWHLASKSGLRYGDWLATHVATCTDCVHGMPCQNLGAEK